MHCALGVNLGTEAEHFLETLCVQAAFSAQKNLAEALEGAKRPRGEEEELFTCRDLIGMAAYHTFHSSLSLSSIFMSIKTNKL